MSVLPTGLAPLARSTGTFAMVALDQRETLATMLRAARGRDVGTDEVAAFKVAAARALSPHASAVLLDLDTGLGPVLDAGALAAGCGLIVAADRLTQERGGPVEDTDVDERAFSGLAAARADAFKLLVIWHPDRGREARRRTVGRFLERCRARGRPGIVEGVVRRPASVAAAGWDHPAAVLACAEELGALRPDLYKAEVPTLGAGSDPDIEEPSRRMTRMLGRPWVVLSNGVPPERFDDAAVAACRGGASGFLAGRAIWTASLLAPDPAAHLATVAARRLQALGARIDAAAAAREAR